MQENKGKIDVAAAQKFLADHVDSVYRKSEPSERTLCGHVELSPRGNGGVATGIRHGWRGCKTKLLMQRWRRSSRSPRRQAMLAVTISLQLSIWPRTPNSPGRNLNCET